ncbi:lipopolysaccharide transport periplasmic protein LptA [Candidatus Thioglobus sp.]|nr:lipopolysaccharide transport periplasmic protein LptA [Candidatus Thioglobus sp.]MDC1165895.1 lipopolysaccharide transport periplasmic protein LptA [Candidatus Thioglobus sp.]
MIKKLLLFVCLMPGVSIALQDDATQPINIKAQAVLIDEKKGISIYTGKASVVQGSLILSAEKIQLFSNQTQVTKMIANGDKKQRAHYQQSQPTQPRFIEATANKITYMVQKEMVHLKGNAHLVQGFDSFSGGSLDYDIKKDKVIANKSKDGLQRVRFKIKL